MSIESELTICEHFDSLRQHVDIARETELDNIHTTVRSSNELIAKDVSKRVRAFLDEQHALLQRIQASCTQMILLTVSFLVSNNSKGKMEEKKYKKLFRYKIRFDIICKLYDS